MKRNMLVILTFLVGLFSIGTASAQTCTPLANVFPGACVLNNISGGSCPPITDAFEGNCIAGFPPVNGVCGSANGTSGTTAPTANLCSTGTASAVSGTGPWTWTCAGSNGGTTANCSQSLQTASNPCNQQLGSGTPIFCDTFGTPNPGIPSRTGGLDPDVWGVSRTMAVNQGQGWYNATANSTSPLTLQTCTGSINVTPPNDVAVCNNQLREASNDNPQGCLDCGGITSLAMYPRQPFDFAGRTGTVSFDVSDDSQGMHAAWPEFWVTDLPVPAPFAHNADEIALPVNGFGIRLGGGAPAGDQGACPNSNNINVLRVSVDSIIVVRNYIWEETETFQTPNMGTPSNPPLTLQVTDCVIASPDNSGIFNHFEFRINQNEIDVYATDAGVAPTPSTLREIAIITNANLSFTRGLVWFEDDHYNADKGSSPSQHDHTFVWGNLAFDGPFPGRDFGYDALDSLQAVTNYPYLINLGQYSGAGQTASWNVLNVPANPNPAAVRVLFNFQPTGPTPTVLNVIVNGNTFNTPWPYPDQNNTSWRTLSVTVPVTALVAGTNVVQIGSDQGIVSSNVDIVLAGVPGAVPVQPGSNNAYP